MKLTQNNLINYLSEMHFDPKYQKETDQIYLILKIKGLEVPVFFGIRSEGHVLQTIAYLPYELHKSTLADIARLLHLLNREIDIPGFGMDELQKLMFFRCTIPCLEQELKEKLIDMYLATTRIACESFMEAIAAIASGSAKFDDVVKNRGNHN